jgi:hypothetical protein
VYVEDVSDGRMAYMCTIVPRGWKSVNVTSSDGDHTPTTSMSASR